MCVFWGWGRVRVTPFRRGRCSHQIRKQLLMTPIPPCVGGGSFLRHSEISGNTIRPPPRTIFSHPHPPSASTQLRNRTLCSPRKAFPREKPTYWVSCPHPISAGGADIQTYLDMYINIIHTYINQYIHINIYYLLFRLS